MRPFGANRCFFPLRCELIIQLIVVLEHEEMAESKYSAQPFVHGRL